MVPGSKIIYVFGAEKTINAALPLAEQLTRVGISHRVDESGGSIGRRYARTDQIAIPYGITIDFDTINQSPPSATLRERDTMKQIRVPVSAITGVCLR